MLCLVEGLHCLRCLFPLHCLLLLLWICPFTVAACLLRTQSHLPYLPFPTAFAGMVPAKAVDMHRSYEKVIMATLIWPLLLVFVRCFLFLALKWSMDCDLHCPTVTCSLTASIWMGPTGITNAHLSLFTRPVLVLQQLPSRFSSQS